MIHVALLGFASGAIAATATLLILVPVRPQAVRAGGIVKVLAVGAFALPLLGLLALTGTRAPDLPADAGIPAQAPAMQGDNGGDDLALASHMLMGGPPPGAGGSSMTATGTARAGHSIEELQSMAAGDPGNARIWLALANAQRQSRDYAAAAKSFDKSLRLDAGNADAWADYADALASAGDRRLAGAPADAIAHALKLDAKHTKALWLQASLDLEQHRYKEALQHWQSLRAALPAGSPDISIVEANIAEARQLVTQAAGGG